MNRLVASERGRIAGIQSEANRRVTEFEEKTKVVQFSYGEKCEEVKKLEQIIRDRDEEIRGIINRDADFDPEKDKNEALAKQKIEFDQQLAKKEVGYKQLIADFSNMEKKKAEELEMLKETSTKVRQQLEEEMLQLKKMHCSTHLLKTAAPFFGPFWLFFGLIAMTRCRQKSRGWPWHPAEPCASGSKGTASLWLL
eukprot:g3422.t1